MVEYKKIFNPYTGRHQKVLDETSIGGGEDSGTANSVLDNILLNAFHISVNGSLLKYNMVDGIMDEFEDESGIDNVNSLNENYSISDNLYNPKKSNPDIVFLSHFDGEDGDTTTLVTPPMVEFNNPSGIVTATPNLNGQYPPHWVFNQTDTSTSSWLGTGAFPRWVQYAFDEGTTKTVTKYSIQNRNTGAVNSPRTWQLLGSNNGTDWTELHSVVDDTNNIQNDIRTFTFLNTTAYRYFRLSIDVQNGGDAYLGVNELMLYEVSPNIKDESLSEHPMMCYGDAQLDSAQKKWGTTSLLLDGTGDYVTCEDSSDFAFGTGDFTIEMQIRPTQVTSQMVLLDTRGSNPSAGVYFYIANGNLRYYDYNTDHASTTPLLANVWQHIAIVRVSGVLYFYVNGVDAGGSFALTRDLTTQKLTIGKAGAGNDDFYSGWIDEVMIAKGTASYDGNFTPPTEPISIAVENMTLISESTEAEDVPDSVRIVVMAEDVDSIILNTDVKVYASRDDGANWVQATLTKETDIGNGKKVLAGTADISGQASDKTMRWKLETLNEKDMKIHGLGELWN